MPRRSLLAALAALLLLAAPLVAQAATPRKGAAYTGKTSQDGAFSLRVAKNGKTVTRLRIAWVTNSCASGAEQNIQEVTEVTNLKVNDQGAFRLTGTYSSDFDTVTITLRGRFTSDGRARGSFHARTEQRSCLAKDITWRARARPRAS